MDSGGGGVGCSGGGGGVIVVAEVEVLGEGQDIIGSWRWWWCCKGKRDSIIGRL